MPSLRYEKYHHSLLVKSQNSGTPSGDQNSTFSMFMMNFSTTSYSYDIFIQEKSIFNTIRNDTLLMFTVVIRPYFWVVITYNTSLFSEVGVL